MAKVTSTITIHHGGQIFEVLCLEDDTIRAILNRNDVPLDGAVTKNGQLADAGATIKDGDAVAVSPKSGAQG